MKQYTILTKKNCHRAKEVRLIANPENGVWQFKWRGERRHINIMRCEFLHIASQEGVESISISDRDNEMNVWEIISWKYEENFEDLWEQAVRAYSATSFNPEIRAAQFIRDYEGLLQEDLKQMTTNDKEQYVTKFRGWLEILLERHSRIMSAMIVGPAKFPSKRNEKMNNSYDKALAEFNEWRERALKAIARRIENAKPQEQKFEEAWQKVKLDIDNYFIPSNLYNRMETIANRGEVELITRAIEYVRELNKSRKKPIFTERHRFFKLAEVAQAVRDKMAERENQESRKYKFDGGVVVYNYAEDRLQIVYDSKPTPDIISTLKHSGFRWSPYFSAWQRQLTPNARYAAKRITGYDESQKVEE